MSLGAAVKENKYFSIEKNYASSGSLLQGTEVEFTVVRSLIKEQPAIGAGNPAVVEHPLEAALASPGSEKRGFGMETVKVKCQSCHAISVFPAGRAAQRWCPPDRRGRR